MQYGQIVVLLTLIFAAYYAVMIVMDLHKANVAKALEAENAQEEDIDISDEAKRFSPVKVSRDIKVKSPVNGNSESANDNIADNSNSGDKPQENDNQQLSENQEQTDDNEQVDDNEQTDDNEQGQHEDYKPYRPDLPDPLMTDGVTLDKLIEAVDHIAETGTCDLGDVIYHCEKEKEEMQDQ